MSDINRIKDKLAKLLRLGENDAASEGEIQNALNAASQLMAKYQLTREDIDTSAADPVARVALGRHFAFCKSSVLTTWESVVASFVTSFIGSVSCYNAGKMPVRKNGIADFFGGAGEEARQAVAIAFYGSDEDARCAAELFEELRDAISTMALIRWGGWQKGEGGAYAYGFACGLREANAKAKLALREGDATTSALILKSEQHQLAIVNKATDWLAATHNVKLKKNAGARRVGYQGQDVSRAAAEGLRDGSNYNVSRPGARQRIS